MRPSELLSYLNEQAGDTNVRSAVAPVQSLVEVTTLCNQHCQHCLVGTSLPGEHELSFDEIRGVLDQLHEMGVIQVNFTGGEPTVRKDIFDILEYTTTMGDAHEFWLLTNGTLWNPEKIKRFDDIVSRQPNFTVQVSLDSISHEIYNRFRAGRQGDLDKVKWTIRQLRDRGIKTTSCICVTRLNADHVLETARYALEELGVSGVHVVHLFPSGTALTHYWDLEPTLEQWGRVVMGFTKVKKDRLWGQLSHKVSVSYFNFYEFFYALMSQGGTAEDLKVWGYSGSLHKLKTMNGCIFCKTGYEDICVSSVGNVYPCMCSRSSDVIAGNVREHSLKEIYEKSPVYRWFRSRNVWKVADPCASCPFHKICMGGCRVSAYNMTGDMNSSDLRCPRANGSLRVPQKWVDELSQLVDLSQ